MEENILRYVAGYVCRKTREKLEVSVDVNKDDMIFCLFSSSGDETTDSRTEDWTNLMDRGGLWHVNDMVYDCFYTLETELRQQLAKTEKIETCLNGITEKMLVNEDVLFRWWLISVDFDDAISGRLMKRIINLYITINQRVFICSQLYRKI